MIVRRIAESVQTDVDMLRQLHAAGIDPGATVNVAQDRDEVVVDKAGEKIRLPRELASRVFVTRVEVPAGTDALDGGAVDGLRKRDHLALQRRRGGR